MDKDDVIVRITTVANGLSLTIERPDQPPHTVVYQNCDEEEDEVERFADFLYFLTDEFGPMSSRYSRRRIQTRIVSGDKYEGPDRIED